MGKFMYTGLTPKTYWANDDPSKKFNTQQGADEYAAQLAIQKNRSVPSLDSASTGKIGDGRQSMRELTAPGTHIGQTEAGQAAYGHAQEQEQNRQRQQKRALYTKGLQEFADKHGSEVSKDMINFLANIGALDEGLKQVIQVNATKQKEAETAQGQDYKTGEREATQDYKIGEREATQDYKTGEREDTQEYKTGEREEKQNFTVLLEKLKEQGNEAREQLRAGKTKTNDALLKKLGGVNNAFDQLKEQHEEIWLTGPGIGHVGKLNVVSAKRKAFSATRAFLLKNIAMAFEGSKISDKDMKFYEKMVPDVVENKAQFDAMKNSIMDLIEWRIKSVGETGQDPGSTPKTSGVPDEVLKQAQEALNDPNAPEEVKARARQIIGK